MEEVDLNTPDDKAEAESTEKPKEEPLQDEERATKPGDQIDASWKRNEIRPMCYNMQHMQRGTCIIINNVNFPRMGYRQGSDRDAERLEEVFRSLKFSVRRYDNLGSRQMLDYVKKCMFLLILVSLGLKHASCCNNPLMFIKIYFIVFFRLAYKDRCIIFVSYQ